ncbi:hypothetical protein J4234_02970 [Candidatus Woesearchaeota archaeon]|nr:hypothetical protein [Candidatus Woesearchaeota archaeon]
MRKEVLLVLMVLLIIVITACEKIDVSKLSDKDLERISKELIVCNKPYIRYSSECCLDKNDNAICDKDDGLVEEKETPSGITPPVIETPAEPTKPEVKEKEAPKSEVFQEKCTLQAGLACFDYKATATSLRIVFKNSLGYDIMVTGAKAQQCTALTGLSFSVANGNSGDFTFVCVNAGSKYDGQLNVTYTTTNLDGSPGIQHTNVGQIMAKITS